MPAERSRFGNSAFPAASRQFGGAGVEDLATALQQLSEKIGAAGELGAMEKQEANGRWKP